MKHRKSPRFGSALLFAALSLPLHAQSIDWGTWNSSGTGIYANGDSIAITNSTNASITAEFGETTSTHSITDPAFPLANAPGDDDYGFFHNADASTAAWSVVIDLTNFTLNSGTVIGFSNLDGINPNDATPGYAVIQFLDSTGTPMSISSASFLGNYDTNWQGVTWDADSIFDTATGRWDVAANSSTQHFPGTYFANVGDAFFLTNLPAGVEKIAFFKTGTTYRYDSIAFYAGNAVPEPSGFLLTGLAGVCLGLRRRRPAA